METQSKISGNIKLLFVVLGVVTIISLVNFFNSFVHNPYRTSATLSTTEALEDPDQDVDHDGLSNTEESYWNTDFQNADTDRDGFKDGEEVASGHNPTIAGPDDSLTDINITEKAADLILGGLYSGDLDPEAPGQGQKLEAVSSSVLYDFYDGQPDVPRTVLVERGNTTEDQMAYLSELQETVSRYLFSSSQQHLNRDQSLFDQRGFFTEQAQRSKKVRDELAKIRVPSDWRTVHLKAIDITQRFESNYQAIAMGNVDPIKGILALGEIQNIQKEVRTLLGEIQELAVKNNLRLTGQMFDILNLLYQ